MADDILKLYEDVRNINERIYFDEFGGSVLKKCFLMALSYKIFELSNFVEIGVYRGKSLFSTSVAVKEFGGQTFGIDPYLNECLKEKDISDDIKNLIDEKMALISFPEIYKDVMFLRDYFNMSDCVEIIRKTSAEALSDIKKRIKSIGMLHIDGNHDYDFVKFNAENYCELVKDNGIIVFDDIDWQSVRIVYEEVKKKYTLIVEENEYGIILKTSEKDIDKEILDKLHEIQREASRFQEIKDSSKLIDLVIVDDYFPSDKMSFRDIEFNEYLKHFDSIMIYTNCGSQKRKDDIKLRDLIKKANSHKVIMYPFNSYMKFDDSFKSRLAYFCFLNNAFYCIDGVEKNKIPFVFELYPGGGFALDNEESDYKLKRLFSSPFFRKVIVTQNITYSYLINKKFCEPNKIEFIYGGAVISEKSINCDVDNCKRYGINKNQMDICFVANKYTKLGEDKGYDIFIEAAKKIVKKIDNVMFHVLGGFDENVIDVSDIQSKIKFYEYKTAKELNDFYYDKDIIISPVKSGVIIKGAFDGFPTTTCVDAALRKVAIFSTCEFEKDNGFYINGKNFVEIDSNSDDILNKIEYYYNNPNELELIAENGRMLCKKLYSFESQMKPRIEILNKEIQNYTSNLIHAMEQATEIGNKGYLDLRNAYTNLLEGYENLKKSYDNLSTGYNDLHNAYDNLSTGYNDLQSNNMNLSLGYNDLKVAYENLNKGYSEINEEYKKLENEYRGIQGAYANLENSKKQLNAEKIIADNTIARLEDLIKEYEIFEARVKKTIWWNILGKRMSK